MRALGLVSNLNMEEGVGCVFVCFFGIRISAT